MSKDINHISWANILAAADQALEADELERVFSHIAQCHECNRNWQKVQGLQPVFPVNGQSDMKESCLDAEKIAAYLDGDLSQS